MSPRCGLLEEALPLETRPCSRARLTTWELRGMGAPFRLLVASAAASVFARGLADVVLIRGPDRAEGDTANKMEPSLSPWPASRRVMFLVVAPESTVDVDARTEPPSTSKSGDRTR